jgi:sulfur carrier protein
MQSSEQTLITLNGEVRNIPETMTVRQFIEYEQIPGHRFVIVINDEIIPKVLWEQKQIEGDDKVDIVSPISGG